MTEAVAATGPRLKAERERRGLSSQKAADELHLDGWVIDALEAENYERIGPSVYAKGHLKRYAALLGLPLAEIMAGYESRSLAPKAPPAPAANVRLRTDAPAVSNLPWTQIAGTVAVLLLVLGVLWWKPWHQRGGEAAAGVPGAGQPAAGVAGAGQPAAGAPVAVASAGGTAATGSGAAPAADAANGTTALGAGAAFAASGAPAVRTPAALTPAMPQPAPGAAGPVAPIAPENVPGMGRARLRLSFSADSWVDVHDADGRRVFAGNGRANTVRTIAGPAPMRVYLGIASGVQLEINNRAIAIGPQFVFGDVARFEAGADGVLRRDSRAAPGASAPGASAPGVATPRASAPGGAASAAQPRLHSTG